MTRDEYRRALSGDSLRVLNNAYCTAMREAYDMRFKPEKRAAAREFLPRLTAEMRKRIEKEKPAGGVV